MPVGEVGGARLIASRLETGVAGRLINRVAITLLRVAKCWAGRPESLPLRDGRAGRGRDVDPARRAQDQGALRIEPASVLLPQAHGDHGGRVSAKNADSAEGYACRQEGLALITN